MARIKIQLPEQRLFEATIPVRITDINYGNHMGNDSFVSILHEARMQWLRSKSWTELNIDGTGLIMSDLAVEFKSEVFYGDDLTVTIYVDSITETSFELYYSMHNREKALVAKAKTGMICYNYSAKKIVAVPANLRIAMDAMSQDL